MIEGRIAVYCANGSAFPKPSSEPVHICHFVKRHLTHDARFLISGRVEIESIRHKALRAFAETGKAKGLPGNLIGRLRNMLAYLSAIESIDELKVPPNRGAHQLIADREGEWSLTVTKNWRMTFRINSALAIEDMDLEDYH